jgi:hypothetical protein
MRKQISLAFAAAALVSAAPAQGAPEWQSTQGLTPARGVIDYRVAAGGDGDVHALAFTSGGPTGNLVELFRRPPGGDFGAPTAFTGDVIFGRERALAAGRGGHALAVWTAQPQGDRPAGLFASFREPGGDWAQPEELPLGQLNPFRVEAAVGPDGTGLIAVTAFVDGRSQVAALVRRPDGAVDGPTTLTPADGRHRTSGQVAVDAAGNATFLWALNQFGHRRLGAVEVVTRPAGGEFSEPVRISSSSENARRFPMLAVGPEGHAVAAWHVNVRGRGLVLRAAVRRIGASRFGRPQTISAARTGEASVAAGRDGALIAVYRLERRRGGPEHARATFFSPRRGWLRSEVLSRGWREVADPNAGFNAEGDAIVTWGRLNRQGSAAAEAAVRPRGGRFGRSETVSDSRRRGTLDVQLAVTPAGEAVAFWTRSGGGGGLFAAEYTEG